MSDNVGVYLFSSEAKESYCLSPMVEILRQYFPKTNLVSTGSTCELMASFSVEECPVGVFSSLVAYDFAKFIRGGAAIYIYRRRARSGSVQKLFL